MRSASLRVWLVAIAYYAALLVVGIGAGMGTGVLMCRSRWSGTGVPYRYRGFAGCQVEAKPGRWLPETAYREVAP